MNCRQHRFVWVFASASSLRDRRVSARVILVGEQVLRACERALLWDEAVYLYKEDGQYDSAVKTMIDHCVCFQHELFLECVKKVRRREFHVVCYNV